MFYVEYWLDSRLAQRMGAEPFALDDDRFAVKSFEETPDLDVNDWDPATLDFVAKPAPPSPTPGLSIPVSDFLNRIGDVPLAIALTLPDPQIGLFKFKLAHAENGRISLDNPKVIAGVHYLASITSLGITADDVTRILAPVEG